MRGVYQVVGEGVQGSSPPGGGPGGALRSNIAAVQFQLLGAEERSVSSIRFEELWREEVGVVPAARSVSYSAQLVGFGADINVELTHPDPVQLERAGQRVVEELASFQGVFDVETSQDQGLREIQLRLKPAARGLLSAVSPRCHLPTV